MDYRLLGSSICRIFQARILEWVAIAFSRGSSQHRILLGLPDPEIKPGSPVMQADSLPSEPLGAPCVSILYWCFSFFLFLNFFFKFIYFNRRLITLQYFSGFAIHWHESAMGIHAFPILNPPPTSLLIPSLWVIPVHQLQALCLMHWTWTGIHFIYDNIHVSMPFSEIIPPLPSPTESKRLFSTSVSLLLSHIQGYHCHLSKFHIYALVYCIGVFLSGLFHSV